MGESERISHNVALSVIRLRAQQISIDAIHGWATDIQVVEAFDGINIDLIELIAV